MPPVPQVVACVEQLPAEHESAPLQATPSSQADEFDRGPQVPFVVAPAATLHAWQSLVPPAQAESQQTPSVQMPVAQSEGPLHGSPLLIFFSTKTYALPEL